MQISTHFSLQELTRTEMRQFEESNYHAAGQDNRVLTALRALSLTLLEPVRLHFNAPVVIHSAFRSIELDYEIKRHEHEARARLGKPPLPTSQHTLGEAADFHVNGVSLEAVFDWVRQDSGLHFGQVILEGRPSWIHLSLGAPFRDGSKCGQALRATRQSDGTMAYERVL